MCMDLGSSIILVPVIAVLGNVAIAKAFGMHFTIRTKCFFIKFRDFRPLVGFITLFIYWLTASGNSVDATQELYCLGVCNLLGSFVSSMPVTGSFSRSAVNHASGVRTPMGGMYTGKYIIYYLTVHWLTAIVIEFRRAYHFGVEFADTVLLLHTQSSSSGSHHQCRHFHDRIRDR